MPRLEWKDIPTTFYTRFHAKRQGDDPTQLYGFSHSNSHAPFFYGRDKDVLKEIFNLAVTVSWSKSAIVHKESEEDKQLSNHEYVRRGYSAVCRQPKDIWTVFHPKRAVETIKDRESGKLLYEKKDVNENYNHHIPDDFVTVYDTQSRVDKLLASTVGEEYIDKKKDYFNVLEISRRREWSLARTEATLRSIIQRITVNSVSGCWVSTSKSDYRVLFWLALGGMWFDDIFHFPNEKLLRESCPTIIKNKLVLHSLLCELTLREDHACCCRPQHLRLGTSAENALHIKVRRNLDQVLMLDKEDMKRYAYHIYALADIINRRMHFKSEKEYEGLTKKGKTSRVLLVEKDGDKFVQKVRNPDMGDMKDEDFYVDEPSPSSFPLDEYMNTLRKTSLLS